MAIATATITMDLADQLGVDFDARRTKVWVTTNVPDDTVIDKAANKIRLGSGTVTVNTDGTASVVVWVPGVDSNPASWQTTIHVDYPDRNQHGGRGRRDFGPYTITASGDLADLVAEQDIPVTYLTQAMAVLDTAITKGPKRNKNTTPARLDRILSDRQIIGTDPATSTYWAWNSAGGLWQLEGSNIYAATNAGWYFKSLPSGVGASTLGRPKVLKFKGKVYLLAKSTAGTPGLWRADAAAGGTAFTWSASLLTLTSGADILGTDFVTDGNYLYLGEYGAPTGGPKVYRSADGSTWETVLGPLATSNHIHGIGCDPYNPGHVYVTIGDNTPVRHMRSTQSGAVGTFANFASQDASWQAVQISFSKDYVWYASDGNRNAWTAFRLDRKTDTFEWASWDWHHTIAVPGGRGGRAVSDLAFTNGSTTITSATANFTAADVGAAIRPVNSSFYEDTVIRSVTNTTTAVVDKAPAGTSATTTAIIAGDQFYMAAYFGTVDPATGIYYCVANDSSFTGNTPGLFAITPDGQMHLLKVLSIKSDIDLFIADGFLWYGQYRVPLLT